MALAIGVGILKEFIPIALERRTRGAFAFAILARGFQQFLQLAAIKQPPQQILQTSNSTPWRWAADIGVLVSQDGQTSKGVGLQHVPATRRTFMVGR